MKPLMNMKKRENILACLVVVSILLVQLFPMHLHIHNHFHADSNQYVSSELEFIHFEKHSSDHEHAVVSDVTTKIPVKISNVDSLIVLLVLFVLLLSLNFFIGRFRLATCTFRLRPPHIKPLLRAPPAQA